MCFSFTPYYFAYIHIEYHIEMSPLAPHAFLGMPSIFNNWCLFVMFVIGRKTFIVSHVTYTGYSTSSIIGRYLGITGKGWSRVGNPTKCLYRWRPAISPTSSVRLYICVLSHLYLSKFLSYHLTPWTGSAIAVNYIR